MWKDDSLKASHDKTQSGTRLHLVFSRGACPCGLYNSSGLAGLDYFNNFGRYWGVEAVSIRQLALGWLELGSKRPEQDSLIMWNGLWRGWSAFERYSQGSRYCLWALAVLERGWLQRPAGPRWWGMLCTQADLDLQICVAISQNSSIFFSYRA